RNGGRAGSRQVIPRDWIEASWRPRTQSIFHDDHYGYGWFLTEMAGQRVSYAWGYGGQMIYVAPSLGLTVIMTSTENHPSARSGHRDRLHGLMRSIVAAMKAEQA
ncbi:MAG TPA: 6-aminohexanoate hydrolase, partial [Kiloniellaceae bacterium]